MATADPGKPVPSGKHILTNLLPHSSFDNAGWTSGANCTVSYDSTIKKYGNYSLKVTSNAGSLTECYFYSNSNPPQVKGHIYYGRCEMYQSSSGISSGMQIYWPEAEPSMGTSSYDSAKAGTWQIQSFRLIRNSWASGLQKFRFDVEQIRSPNYVYVDGAMLIDLTATYGAGNEPTQAWCDANIPYFSGTLVIGKLNPGDIINFDYSGAGNFIELPAGKYKLEAWGAQGGNYSSYKGGYGGYSVGVLSLAKKTPLYVYSGEQGSSSAITGGFNGGGSGIKNGRGGGGGTDIRVGQDSLYSRVIVAGGGGGSGVANVSGKGVGGGTTGLGGYTNETTTTGGNRSGGGGTQSQGGISWNNIASTNGSFGQGGNASGYSCGGGGGGWYGGGGAYDNDSDSDGRNGGGGSGYIYTASTASNYPSGCLLNSSHYLSDAQTATGATSFPSPTGANETGHTGNGYARITVIEVSPTFSAPVKISGNWKVASDGLVKINGAWKSVEQGFVKINGTWKEIS